MSKDNNKSRNILGGEEFFFVNKAKDFDVDKMGLPVGIRSLWSRRCRLADRKPDKYLSYMEMLLGIIRFRRGINIVDVGCGVGTEIIELSHLGANCIGLDVHRDAIELVNSVKNFFGLEGLECVYGDACNLPFKDETFDVVMSNQLFEHVIDINAVVTEQIRILKRGGRLIIEQANLLNPLTLMDLLIKYPIRTHGKYGGFKWLLAKSKVKKNIYGTGWDGKDEDVHSRVWWMRKIKEQQEIETLKFTSNLTEMKVYNRFLRLLAPFIGNILIVARKK